MENSFISDFGIESSSELPVVPSVPIGLKKRRQDWFGCVYSYTMNSIIYLLTMRIEMKAVTIVLNKR